MRRLFCILLLASLPMAEASATVVGGSSDDKGGPQSGGVDVTIPEGRVRLQCWQDGEKIIDEAAQSIVSMSLSAQANSISFGRPGDEGRTSMLLSQFWTTCLLKRVD